MNSASISANVRFAEVPKPGKIPKSGSKERLQMVEELNFEGQRTLDGAVSRMVSHPDSADAIRELAKLRDEGLISEEEYEAKRREMLEDL